MKKLRQSIVMALVQGNCQIQGLNIGWCKKFRSLHDEVGGYLMLNLIAQKRETLRNSRK